MEEYSAGVDSSFVVGKVAADKGSSGAVTLQIVVPGCKHSPSYAHVLL